MKYLLLLIPISFYITSCGNSADQASKVCDTICQTDSLKFTGDHQLNPTVAFSFRDCAPDSLVWYHDLMDFSKNVEVSSFLGQAVRINPSAVHCLIQDTTQAWLTFNDCTTGRGYLLKLPFSKNAVIGKYTGALNDFDPKFSIDPDLRAYTDRGSVFVVNIKTGAEATMSFKEAYDIDFNKIHETVDSVNITKSRIYVKLLKNGTEVPIEKEVQL